MDPEHCLYLGDNGVQDLALEGAEDDGLVLDGIDDKPLARLDQARPHTVNCRHCNHEPVFACKKHMFCSFTTVYLTASCRVLTLDLHLTSKGSSRYRWLSFNRKF